MRVAMLLALSGMVLAGCTGEGARADWQQRRAACSAQHPAVPGQYAARARCEAPVQREMAAAERIPSELSSAYLATRADLAAAVDRGALAPEEAGRRLAQAGTAMDDAVLARRPLMGALQGVSVTSYFPREAPAPRQPCPQAGDLLRCGGL